MVKRIYHKPTLAHEGTVPAEADVSDYAGEDVGVIWLGRGDRKRSVGQFLMVPEAEAALLEGQHKVRRASAAEVAAHSEI